MEEIIKMLTTENELIYNIIAYPLAVLEFTVLFLVIKSIYKIDSNRKNNIIFVLICAIIGTTVRIILPMPFNFICNFVLITIVIMSVLKLSWFKAIIPFGIFLISTAVSELIITIFLSKGLSLNLEAACNTPIFQVCCSIAIYCLALALVKIISYFKTNLNLSDAITIKEKSKFIINVLVAIIIVYPNVIFLISVDMQIPTYYIIYNLVCALFLFFLTTYNTHKFNKYEITKRELETANLYNNTLSQLVDSNRSFKHDMDNIFQSIRGYIELNDIEGLKQYFDNGILPEVQKAYNLSLLNPNIINSPPLFGLLVAKYNYAQTKKVEMKMSSFLDYSSINMNVYDCSKVLGILLDNAIEASSISDEKEVELYISIDFYNRKQNIQISNTYSNKDIDLDKIFEKDYSTKEKKSGFGLWEVKQIIKKTPNVKLLTSKTDKLVIQKLEIKF